MATRKILLEDGANGLLLQDGTNFLVKEGVAQASDDVLIRIGPGVNTTTGSGLVTPAFTAISVGGGGTGLGSMYYQMMQNWFEAA